MPSYTNPSFLGGSPGGSTTTPTTPTVVTPVVPQSSSSIFSSLFGAEFKALHKTMMDGILSDDSLTVQCTISYRATKFDDCPNCIFDPIGGKSSNRYQAGGPIAFSHGICPYCGGAGRLEITAEETIYLLPIWNSKDWYPMSQNNINMADMSVQTLSRIDTHENLIRATSIIIDTDVEQYGIPEFTRLGHPEICGLGQSSHILTAWKRS